MQNNLSCALEAEASTHRSRVLNHVDALAAGLAATRGGLEQLVRVWYLGDGIGFGRYPRTDAPWEVGHSVVSLDPKERYCGCGGVGHLEGIMGNRAMRLRFLDMEPEDSLRRSAPRRPEDRAISSSAGIARWPPPPLPSSTPRDPAASTLPARTPNSSTSRCSAATSSTW